MIGAMCDERNEKNISPSRTYVAVCNNYDFSGYYFRKFTLPTEEEFSGTRNDAEFASWYFLNELNSVACIDGCISFENYSDIKDERNS